MQRKSRENLPSLVVIVVMPVLIDFLLLPCLVPVRILPWETEEEYAGYETKRKLKNSTCKLTLRTFFPLLMCLQCYERMRRELLNTEYADTGIDVMEGTETRDQILSLLTTQQIHPHTLPTSSLPHF